MRIWIETASEVPFLPDIELQMAKRSDPTAKIIKVEL